MLGKTLMIAVTILAGEAMADEAPKANAPLSGQSVTGPASEQSASGNASASASRNKAAKSSTSTSTEKPDGKNGGENGFSKEDTPGVNSSTTNSF